MPVMFGIWKSIKEPLTFAHRKRNFILSCNVIRGCRNSRTEGYFTTWTQLQSRVKISGQKAFMRPLKRVSFTFMKFYLFIAIFK